MKPWPACSKPLSPRTLSTKRTLGAIPNVLLVGKCSAPGPGSRHVRRWRRRSRVVLLSGRSRIMYCRRRAGHVGRPLVKRLRRIPNVRVLIHTWSRPLGHSLRRLLVDRLRRSAIRALHRARRIGAPHISAVGIHTLPWCGRVAAQERARSRRGTSGRSRWLRTNVDSVDR